jgi:hypothetical protein
MLRGGSFDRYGAECVQRAMRACLQIPALRRQSDAVELLETLVRVKDIDVGEAQLIAHALDGGHFLTSGDKRWMRALCNEPQLAPAVAALSGRVICMEAVVEALVARIGFAETRSLLPQWEHHTGLRVLCRSSDEAEMLAALASYIQDLETHVGPRFLWRPEPSS